MTKTTKKSSEANPPTLRATPQQTRGQERVDLILDVSEKLLLSKGYEALTTNAVAAEAGISIGSLYHFFADKVAILEALITRYNEAYIEALMNVHQDKSVKLESYVDILLTTLIRFSEGRPGVIIAMSHAITASEKFAAMETDFKTQVSAMMGAAYRQRNPKLTEKKAALIAWTIVVIAEGFLLSLGEDDTESRYGEIKKAIKGYLELYL